ncbi:hypothetical protein TRFO_01365 [Tritrichomonas foetus]|uniref:Uncharacterized protein n=1 Tax=Tritrichomonas foetus TaxID=1144522 RepID=A0A1J4K756_9EUKA|nr:hypothetical protein TRFO_01365 [Tritrichomonas foetus]|eukprot:OHT07207.1 hypothetical protein TRFO_01365 [Tritrichomonas foetus]
MGNEESTTGENPNVQDPNENVNNADSTPSTMSIPIDDNSPNINTFNQQANQPTPIDTSPPSEVDDIRQIKIDETAPEFQQILNYQKSRTAKIRESYQTVALVDPAQIEMIKTLKDKTLNNEQLISQKKLTDDEMRNFQDRIAEPQKLYKEAKECFTNDRRSCNNEIFQTLEEKKEELDEKMKELAKEQAEYQKLLRQYQDLKREEQDLNRLNE